MTETRSRMQRSLAGCAVAVMTATCFLTATPAMADDAPPSGFPSWEQVQKTKQNASATAAEAGKISGLLGTLEAQVGALGNAAVQAGADYASVNQKLEAVSAQVAVLGAQAQRAAEQAKTHRQDAVAVAVQSYKNGGSNLGIFGTIADLESATNLNGVDLLQKIGERAAAKQAAATESQAAAEQLQQTRKGAEAVYAQLTAQAASARDAAVAAQTALTTEIQAQQKQSDTLVAQLAFLNDTSVAEEREYRQGQVALADYKQAQDAKQAAQEEAQRRALAESQAAAQAAQKESAQTLPQQSAPELGTPGGSVQPPPAPKPAPNPAPQTGQGPQPAPKPKPAPQPVPAPEPPAPAPEPPTPGNGGSGSLTPDIPGGAVNDPAGAQAYAASMLGTFGWGQDQFPCLRQLWERESNWRTNATNPYSGAYGIAQSLPASNYNQAGADWLTNYRTQVNWGLGYIRDRYGSPCAAWGHSQSVGWY